MVCEQGGRQDTMLSVASCPWKCLSAPSTWVLPDVWANSLPHQPSVTGSVAVAVCHARGAFPVRVGWDGSLFWGSELGFIILQGGFPGVNKLKAVMVVAHVAYPERTVLGFKGHGASHNIRHSQGMCWWRVFALLSDLTSLASVTKNSEQTFPAPPPAIWPLGGLAPIKSLVII